MLVISSGPPASNSKNACFCLTINVTGDSIPGHKPFYIMNIIDLAFRGIKLSLGMTIAAGAADDARDSVRTFRQMVDNGEFEIVDSTKRFSGEDNVDGLKMTRHAVASGAKGYLAYQLIGDAIR